MQGKNAPQAVTLNAPSGSTALMRLISEVRMGHGQPNTCGYNRTYNRHNR